MSRAFDTETGASLIERTAEIVAPVMGASWRSVFDIAPRVRRTRPEAMAHTSSIYLAHTVANVSLRQLEEVLWVGRKELRRTVRLVEESREDAAFDALLARLEGAVKQGVFA